MSNPIDQRIGERLRGLRTANKLTQRKLAAKLNLSAQQLQKYECGSNRVAASRLVEICRELGVEPNFFYEGLMHDSSAPGDGKDDIRAGHIAALFKTIPDQPTKDQVYELVKTLAAK